MNEFIEYKENYIHSFEKKVLRKLKDKKELILDYKLIPNHLHRYLEKNFLTLINNAKRAKYDFTENKEYKIVVKEGMEKEIIPVDHHNTGVSMKNTILSNGIHQFLQIKH